MTKTSKTNLLRATTMTNLCHLQVIFVLFSLLKSYRTLFMKDFFLGGGGGNIT